MASQPCEDPGGDFFQLREQRWESSKVSVLEERKEDSSPGIQKMRCREGGQRGRQGSIR